jgi:GNAT superfamily N-acetyltransferase
MPHLIRPVRADEWPKDKALWLEALADPAAPVAFMDTLREVSGRPDFFWRENLARSAHGRFERKFVAEGPDGDWAATVAVLLEVPGDHDAFGEPIHAPQAQLAGAFVRAEHRGSGLAARLFEGAAQWAWTLREPAIDRIRLFVHRDNPRAEAFYRRFGFVATGVVLGSTHEMEIARA